MRPHRVSRPAAGLGGTLLPFLYPQVPAASFRTAAQASQFAKSHRELPSGRPRLGRSIRSPASFHTSTAPLASLRRHGKAVEPLTGRDEDASEQRNEQSGAALKGLGSAVAPLETPDPPMTQDTIEENVRKALRSDSVLHIDQVAIPFDDTNTRRLPPPPPPPPPKERETSRDLMEMTLAQSSAALVAPPEDLPEQHFDTLELVTALEGGGFTKSQAVALMNVLRTLLNYHMLLSRRALVARSDVDNSVYLFRAAVSELKMEMQRTRGLTVEKVRTDRGTLQSEQDQLNQRLQQDLQRLKDDLASMFNDRKLLVGQELREMHGRIQNLNLKITRTFGADIKSEVEQLRWILTRRGVLAIFMAGFAVLVGLRIWTDHAREEAQKEHYKEVEMETRSVQTDEVTEVQAAEADADAIASTG